MTSAVVVGVLYVLAVVSAATFALSVLVKALGL